MHVPALPCTAASSYLATICLLYISTAVLSSHVHFNCDSSSTRRAAMQPFTGMARPRIQALAAYQTCKGHTTLLLLSPSAGTYVCSSARCLLPGSPANCSGAKPVACSGTAKHLVHRSGRELSKTPRFVGLFVCWLCLQPSNNLPRTFHCKFQHFVVCERSRLQ